MKMLLTVPGSGTRGTQKRLGGTWQHLRPDKVGYLEELEDVDYIRCHVHAEVPRIEEILQHYIDQVDGVITTIRDPYLVMMTGRQRYLKRVRIRGHDDGKRTLDMVADDLKMWANIIQTWDLPNLELAHIPLGGAAYEGRYDDLIGCSWKDMPVPQEVLDFYVGLGYCTGADPKPDTGMRPSHQVRAEAERDRPSV